MKKKEIINFIYYLEDKIDIVYINEVRKSIARFIDILNQKGI